MKTIRLQHLAKIPITNGLGLSGENDNPDWPRYVRTTDIASARALRDDVFASQPPEIAQQAPLQRNDIVACAAGATIGKSMLYSRDAPACYAGFLVRFRASDDVEPRFISHWMQSKDYWAQIDQGAVRSTIDNFSASKYRALQAPHLPLEDQRRIADFLDDRVARIDQIIAARQQQSLRLNEQFGTHRQLAVRGLEQPTGGSPAPSWIGRIHPGWSTRRSGQVADFFAGVGFPPDEQGASVGHLPLLKVSDLAAANELREVSTAANWVTEEQTAKLGVHPAPEGTILFPKVGAALLTNSRAIAVRPVAFDNNVMGMRFREGDDRYWLHVLHCIDMGAVTNPGPVPSINRENVASLPVPCPPSQEQANIAARLDSALASGRARQSQLGRQIELLQEYKQSLITAAVTGEFDVTTAAPIPE